MNNKKTEKYIYDVESGEVILNPKTKVLPMVPGILRKGLEVKILPKIPPELFKEDLQAESYEGSSQDKDLLGESS